MVLPGGIAAAQGLPPPLQAPAQRNPVDLTAPQAPPALAPAVQPPPITPSTGPGAAAELRIGRVTVSGNEALPLPALAPAFAGLAGATVPLARIEEARIDILRAYREAGYPFAAVNAGLTPRPEGGADLEFAVVEGYIAEVKLEGDIGPAGTQALRFLNRLIGQRPVSAAAIERALLLVSDIPGVTVRGTLRPLPTEPGALQLVAQLERRWYGGYLNLDNRGYKLVGPWEGLLVAGLNSFTEFGERTELSLYGAQDSTQWFLQGSEEAFIGSSGLRVRLYAGGGETRPSGTLKALGYFGQSQVAGFGVTYPVIRSRPLNLYLVGGFDIFDSTIATGTDIRNRPIASRDAIRTLRFGPDWQFLDSGLWFLPPAVTIGSFRLHQGIRGLGATENGDPLSGRSGAENFGFTKISGEIQRTQPLFSPAPGWLLSIQALFAGQWSDDILPQAEKYYLGGARLGRGYYAGQVTGDRAWGAAFELQLDTGFDLPFDIGIGGTRSTAEFYLFRDIARAFQNRPQDANGRLSSWGGGVRWVVNANLQLDLEGVHRVATRPDNVSIDQLKETAVIFRTLVRF